MDICIHLTDSQSQSLVVSLFLLRREQEILGTTCFMYEWKHNSQQSQAKLISMAAPGWVLVLVKSFQCATSEGKTAMTTTIYTVLLLLSQVS